MWSNRKKFSVSESNFLIGGERVLLKCIIFVVEYEGYCTTEHRLVWVDPTWNEDNILFINEKRYPDKQAALAALRSEDFPMKGSGPMLTADCLANFVHLLNQRLDESGADYSLDLNTDGYEFRIELNGSILWWLADGKDTAPEAVLNGLEQSIYAHIGELTKITNRIAEGYKEYVEVLSSGEKLHFQTR